jgi:hypothetical protein
MKLLGESVYGNTEMSPSPDKVALMRVTLSPFRFILMPGLPLRGITPGQDRKWYSLTAARMLWIYAGFRKKIE